MPTPAIDPVGLLSRLRQRGSYDTYRGAVVMVRVVDGLLKKGDKIRFFANKTDYEVTELGSFQPFPVALDPFTFANAA